MSDIADHLVRRAIDVAQSSMAQASAANSEPEEHEIKQLAAWGIFLLWATTIVYLAMVSAVRATLMRH